MEESHKYSPLYKSDLVRRQEWRDKCVLEPLDSSFLRIHQPKLPESGPGHGTLRKITSSGARGGQKLHIRLTVTIVEAKLNKNYGILSRMNPYVQLRIGHNVFQSHHSSNGGKNPKFNQTFHSFLIPGITSIGVEIYDSRTFTADVAVASSTIALPTTILNSTNMADDWWPLSGKEGEEEEGAVHLVMSTQPVVAPPTLYRIPPPLHGTPTGSSIYSTQPAPSHLTPGDLAYLEEIFPGLESSVIKSTFQQTGGNREATVDILLSMSKHLI